MAYSKKILDSIEAKRKEFKELLILLNRKPKRGKGWKIVKVYDSGRVRMRCQARVDDGNGNAVQCNHPALKNDINCRFHGGRKKRIHKNMEIAIKRELGLYEVPGAALQKELKEVEELDQAKLESIDDELKLGLALLRKYLTHTSDEKIGKDPGKLMWLMKNLVDMKKLHYDMKHAKDVSFTREQVEFLFTRFRMVIIEVVKDSDVLNKISERIKLIGFDLKEFGWKTK